MSGWFVPSWAVVVYNVVQVSFRQRLCPPALLGRMNASVRFIVFGTMPIGGLLGGVLGELARRLPALWVAAAGGFVACLPVVLSPLLGMARPARRAGRQDPADDPRRLASADAG